MDQPITYSDTLRDPEYEPVAGTRYEIADGIIVALKPPTIRNLRAYEDAQRDESSTDVDVAKVVVDGWPDSDDDVFLPVAARAVSDFFRSSVPKLRDRRELSKIVERLPELTALVDRMEKVRSGTPNGIPSEGQ